MSRIKIVFFNEFVNNKAFFARLILSEILYAVSMTRPSLIFFKQSSLHKFI